jgi:MFS family permease
LGVVNTINQTARQSLINSLVPKDELLNAIGLQSSVNNFSKIAGPSAAGVLIAYLGISGCFLVNAISFVFLLFNLYLMELAAGGSANRPSELIRRYQRRIRLPARHRRILHIVGISYLIALFGAPTVDSCPFSPPMCCTSARRGLAC